MTRNRKSRKTSNKRTSSALAHGSGIRPGVSLESYSMNNKATTRIMQIVRGASLASYTTNVGGATNSVYSFQLSDTDNYTELTALYDQYRIKEVELTFVPFYNHSTPGAGQCAGIVYTAPDFDDISATASAALRQYSACIVRAQTDSWSVRLRPRIAVAAYSGTFTSYANVADQWLDCNSPSVQHYGYKVAADASGGTANTWQVFAKYFMEFKSPR